ncbi:class I SAM-dependent methyltransferase [Sphingopyxis panaciterrae]
MTIHRSAATGYASASDPYRTGRPGYPPEAAAWLGEVLGLRADRTVLDLGAGTGNFIPLLKDTGARVLALEPVLAMRDKLAARFGEVELVPGTAEAIALADASVDAVICAQSFHWFATAEALREIHRILAPGGVLGLIWNARDERVPWVAALSAITDAYERGTPRHKSGEWRRVFPAAGFAAMEERHADYRHERSAEQVIVQRTMSVSFIGALPPDEQQRVEQRVRRLIAESPELAGKAEVAFPYRTSMFAYRRTD